MEINENFLANAGFGLVAAGGQALTMQVSSCDASDGHYKRYADVVFNREILLQMAAAGQHDGLHGISPMIDFSPVGTDYSKISPANGVEIFRNFIQNNTAHINKLNFRAPSSGTLPTSVLILTPNIFTGQMDRQVLNVTADTNMYQQQNNIVTMNNVDIFLGRDSIVRFAGSFDEATDQILNIDITIDRYISVERALVQNLQLLQTESGKVIAAAQVLNAEAAKTAPNEVTVQAIDTASKVQIPATAVAFYKNNVKGYDSRGNR